ncbi:MAG TPA: radical SAM protein [Patescibacteria group bacterium]|nr:radical SAM protein [Patescibacteria group bacterium]
MQEKPANFLRSETGAAKARRPAFCRIGIPATCMLKCKMCFGWKAEFKEDPQAPSLSQWRTFIDSLSDFSEQAIEMNFSDTEPLLDEKNLALIAYSVKKGLPVSLHTNGVLIDAELASRIADTGLHQITISLDGMRSQTHDRLRGMEGCYDKVMRAISHLSSRRGSLRIGVQAIILDENLDEMVSLAEWANADGRLSHISFQAVTQPFFTAAIEKWHEKSEYAFLWPKDIKKAHAVIDELIKLKKMGHKIGNSASQLETFKKYFQEPDSFVRKAECNVDFWMNVNRRGDVRMCENMRPIGNIKKGRPQEIWYSQEALHRRAQIKSCKVNCHTLVNCAYEEE